MQEYSTQLELVIFRFLKNKFRVADANKSGYLNFEETRDLCKCLNIQLDKKELRQLFYEANTEKNKANSKEKGQVSAEI